MIVLIEFLVVLVANLIYCRQYFEAVYFEQIAIASLFVYLVTLVGSYFLIEQKTKAATFIFAMIVLSTATLGYVQNTQHILFLVYLATACVITIFLEERYILVYGIATCLIQILTVVANRNTISIYIDIRLYLFLLVCYALGVFNIYYLVRQAKQALTRMERANTSKNAFLAAMAHEIRTPMNAIVGLSERIISEKPDKNIVGYTERIIIAGNNLLTMTNGILDYATVESAQYTINETPYQPYGVIREIADMVNFRLPSRKIDFILLTKNELPPWLLGDEVRIRQILINILTNAVKHTREGEITLSVTWDGNDREGILSFAVTDTGTGIKEADLATIFDISTHLTERSKVEGGGLELTICHQLVELMGGKIKVESAYGTGSTFIISIPQKVDSKGLALKAPGAKILIVEDAAAGNMHLEHLLAPYEVQTDRARNGKECLAKMHAARFDLLLMDAKLSDISTLEIVRQIRASKDEFMIGVGIAIMTSGNADEVVAEFAQYDCDYFLEKPVEREDLETLLIEIIPKRLLVESTDIA
jgi:signal transduction histidine kinase/CheY-like chemotaxis protein